MSWRPFASFVHVVLCLVWNPFGFFCMSLSVVGDIGIGWCPQPSGQGSSFGVSDGLLWGGWCACVRCCGALGMFGARPFPSSVRVLARLSRRSAGNSGRGSTGPGVDWGMDCVLFYFVFFVFVVVEIPLFLFCLFFL